MGVFKDCTIIVKRVRVGVAGGRYDGGIGRVFRDWIGLFRD